MKVVSQSVEVLQSLNGSEILAHIEKCGRVSYKSERNIKDGSAEKFISALIKRDHCLDMETEILTLHGWKNYFELTNDDLFATLNDNNMVEYLPAVSKTHYHYTGDMIHLKSKLVDYLVTDEHKLYACKTTTTKGRKKEDSDYKLYRAKDLHGVSHAYYKTSKGVCFDGIDIPKEIIQLIGFTIGDGNIFRNKVDYHLKKERKLKFLLNLLHFANIGYDEKDYDNYKDISFTLLDSNIIKYKDIFIDIYDKDGNKQVPQVLISSMNSKQCYNLLMGYLNADGHLNEERNIYTFCSVSKKLIGQLQQLTLHCGLSANIGHLSKSGYTEKQNIINLTLNHRCNKPVVNKYDGCNAKTNIINNWSGDVWCVEVPPYNKIYIRRNGKTVWIGNCSVLEHYNITVKFITDRGITHELVRHRLASFTQESTRYVAYNLDKFGGEIQVIKPSEIDTEEKEYAWRISMNNAEKAYFDLLDMGCKPETARSVLPTCTKTELVMTANLREWRHLLKLRTAPDAHPDIRILCIDLLNQLKEKIPVVFDDIEVK